MLAVQATGLTKTYGGGWLRRASQHALRQVNLEIRPGTAFGLIGSNGAGKTTFIKAMLGVLRPTSGEVRVLGGAPDDVRVRRRIGYLPERLHLPGSLRPAEFLASVGRLKRLPLSAQARAELIERVGLSADEGRRISTFSKGMRQRLGLAAALVGNPELLVLDEPTDGVDPLGRLEIRRILSAELARGVTLFLNSHLLAETERLCTQIGVLSAGVLVREGTLESLRRQAPAWRLRFAPGASPDALAACGLLATDRPDVFLSTASDPAILNDSLDAARRTGALLLELREDEKDLEGIFHETLGGGR